MAARIMTMIIIRDLAKAYVTEPYKSWQNIDNRSRNILSEGIHPRLGCSGSRPRCLGVKAKER